MAVSFVWAVVRSSYLDWGSGEFSELDIPLWVRASIFAAFLLPTVALLVQGKWTYWLLGVSGAIGVVPKLPLLPFIQEYAHLVIVLTAISLVVTGPRSRSFRDCGAVKIYVAYLAVCAVSTTLNWFLFQNLWQLKVGLAFLILFGAFAVVLVTTSGAAERREKAFADMLEGAVGGFLAQGLICLVTIPLLFLFQSHEGNDTVFGLAFYERIKSTFPGPVNFGMFLLISVPVALLWMHRNRIRSTLVMLYLQLVPWLVVMSGSRSARIAGAVMLLALLLRREMRWRTVALLPSTIVASYAGFFYNSFPAAIRALFGDQEAATLSFKGHFFDVHDRVGLIAETMGAAPFLSSIGNDLREQSGNWVPWAQWLQTLSKVLNSMFGYGAGVGGYSQSSFPSPHTMFLNALVDTGILGLVLLGLFLAVLAVRLLLKALYAATDADSLTYWLCGLAFFPALLVNIPYVPQIWGFYLTTIILICVVVAGPVAPNGKTGERKFTRLIFGVQRRPTPTT